MSAEEADKTATTDASGGDEEEEWLYGGNKTCLLRIQAFTSSLQRPVWDGFDCKPGRWTAGNVAVWC